MRRHLKCNRAAKALVPHGGWQNWLKDNFQLTERTARRFMQISERFNKTVDVDHFKPSQLTELLALPDAEETEKFIAEKAAEGKRVCPNFSNKRRK